MFAFFSAWLFRFALNPDGVAYLDMAEDAIRTGPARLLNSCWGAGYPALIALALRLFHPSTVEAELTMVHLLNAVLLLVSLAELMVFVQRLTSREQPGHRAMTVSLCAVFYLWAAAFLSIVQWIAPDLCIFALVFWTADLVLGIHLPSRSSWLAHAGLGVAIGLGYYVKQSMLPIGALLLLILAVLPPKLPQARWKLAATALVFFVVTAPFAVWMSMKTGRVTLSENGRLNYLWHVEKIPMVPSDAADYAAYLRSNPLRTPRMLMEKPLVISFEESAHGTYPLLYSPGDWFMGVRPRFNLKRQILSIADNLRASTIFLLASRHVWLGLLVLACLSFAGRRPGVTTPGAACLALWCIGTCMALNVIHVEARYLMPFACVGFALGYAEATRHVDARFYGALMATLIAALIIPTTQDIVAIKAELRQRLGQARPAYFQIARDLQAKGLKSGGKIAVVGFASDAYYAKAAAAQILAQIPDEKSFWRMTEGEMKDVRDRLRQAGVTMIVAPAKPAGLCAAWPGSEQTPDQRYSIFTLD